MNLTTLKLRIHLFQRYSKYMSVHGKKWKTVFTIVMPNNFQNTIVHLYEDREKNYDLKS
jgi:hypothetical protein